MKLNLKNYKHIYMSGIGGTSMSGIAEILLKWGYKVTGSDINYTPQIELLEKSGIKVFIGQVAENIDETIDLLVHTAAVKLDNPELVRAKELNIPIVERGIFLGEITNLYDEPIGIAGTHGKTTTSSMVTCTFMEAGLDPSVQIGANLKILNGNYRVGNSKYFIVEACEYSDSYLNFKQKSEIVLNIDDDHLDYFKNIDNIQKSFEKYVGGLSSEGYLVTNGDDERCLALKDYTKAKTITVGKNEKSDWYYKNVIFDENGCASYDAYYKGVFKKRIKLGIIGVHNVFNSLACIALCSLYGIDLDIVAKALVNFTGAARRMEFKGILNGAKVYDDYGHHPTEIMATAQGIKNKKINHSWVVFEPHTYSRLAQHLQEIAMALACFDNIIITDIYAAREKNTYNISVEDLINELGKLGKKAIHISEHDEIINYLKNMVQENDLILTLGAGNVTKIADKIKKLTNS